MTPDDMLRWAKAAAKARLGVEPYDLTLPDALDAAYDVQDAYVAEAAPGLGGVGGFKLAVNSKPQMDHFGVSEPVWARIFQHEIYRSGVALPRSGYQAISVEPEIAAVLGMGVEALEQPVIPSEARALILEYRAAIELIDTRGNAVPNLRLPQVVACNVFNAGIVLGEAALAPEELDAANLAVTLHCDGVLLGQTRGTAPQPPEEAVAFVLNQARARGVALKSGMVVMCGTHLPIQTLPADAGSAAVDMAELGAVQFSITG